MTPPGASTAHARSTGHARTSVRRGAVPRSPRRVSGPSRAAGGANAARAAAMGRVGQVSGGAVALPRPTGTALVHRIGGISESRTLDRLLRSRGWIALLGALLIGLVFMQVSLLKVNSGMGADVEQSAALAESNALLSSQVSQLESNDRIQKAANDSGMVLPDAGNVRYLGANGKKVGSAAAAGVVSQGEASTAIVPTAPTDTTADGVITPTTADTTTTTPQVTSIVPGTTQTQTPVTQTTAPVTDTTTPATTDTSATAGAVAPTTQTQTPTTATDPAATGASAPATTGGATVGGATPGA